MSSQTRVLSFIALVLLALVGCEAPSATESPQRWHATFESASCPFPLAGSRFKTSDVRCGYVVVPQSRQVDDGKTIKLAVAVFMSESRNPAPDPLVYLEGGPGSPLVSDLGPTIAMSGMPDYVGNRDLILVDQRGAGLSQPSLACGSDETWRECRMRLVKRNIDLSAYNTIESAADIADLGPALGYKKVDLFGNSYGTTLALQIMRDHPRGIRSVVMDGVTGPTFNTYDGYNAYIWHALQRVFADCAASPGCKPYYPHLQLTFTRLLARLQDHPAVVQGFSPVLDRDVSATMSGLDLWKTMREFLAAPTGASLAPSVILSFAAGDYHMAVQFIGNTLSTGSASDVSSGMHYAMDCSGEPAGSSRSTITAHSQMVPASIRSAAIAYITAYLDSCEDWRVPKIPAVNHTYFHSDIPTLLLPGRYDPDTPSPLAKALASRLGNAYLVPIPTLGHLVVGYDPCPDSIAAAFLAYPNRKPDTSCAARMTMTWQ